MVCWWLFVNSVVVYLFICVCWFGVWFRLLLFSLAVGFVAWCLCCWFVWSVAFCVAAGWGCFVFGCFVVFRTLGFVCWVCWCFRGCGLWLGYCFDLVSCGCIVLIGLGCW